MPAVEAHVQRALARRLAEEQDLIRAVDARPLAHDDMALGGEAFAADHEPRGVEQLSGVANRVAAVELDRVPRLWEEHAARGQMDLARGGRGAVGVHVDLGGHGRSWRGHAPSHGRAIP